MLLGHSSGLPAYEKLFEFAHDRKELLRSALTDSVDGGTWGSRQYSDIGFILLGEILERVAGEPLDQFVQHEILDRLGLTRTWFVPPLDLRSQIPPTENDQAFRRRIIQGEVNDENAWVWAESVGTPVCLLRPSMSQCLPSACCAEARRW